MVDWASILRVWIYPLAAAGPILDGLSTYLLLTYAAGTSERNSIVASIHDKFGLTKGQFAFSIFATILWVAGIHWVLITSGIAITSF